MQFPRRGLASHSWWWNSVVVAAIAALCGCQDDSSRNDDVPAGPGDDDAVMLMTFDAASLVYYVAGAPRNLEVYTARVALSVREESRAVLENWLATDPAIAAPVELTDLRRRGLVLVSLADGVTADEVCALIERVNATGFIRYASPVFGSQDAMTFVTDEFIVKFKPESSVAEIEECIDAHHTEIKRKDFLWEKCYLVSFRSLSADNVLDAARLFLTSDLVEWSHPNFVAVMRPSWETLAREDFEGQMLSPGWSAYDANPDEGEYCWGRFATADYPAALYPERVEAFNALFPSGHVGWCAASHDPGSPALLPGENCPESWPRNMDARLVCGPLDLSASYWARVSFVTESYRAYTDTDYAELLVSVDGITWHGGREWDWRSANDGGTFRLTRVPDLGDVTGQAQVWVALRFLSDGAIADARWCKLGLFVDDIIVEASNLAPADPISSDPLSRMQWGLRNTGQSGGLAGFDIKVLEAWSYMDEALGEFSFAGDDGIIVAVIDEGVDLGHEDLNLIGGYDATYDPYDEYRTDSHGGCDPADDHGTACAGIIGARRNDVGVVGVAPGIRIMPVRIAYAVQGRWVTSHGEQADGILWAARNGARVLSNSWGGGIASDVQHAAIQEAKTGGCTVVFAAGNWGGLGSTAPTVFPARYEETIAVAAMSPCGEWKNPESCDGEGWGSCYGPEVDVAAPGVLIATTDITGDNGFVRADALGHTGDYNPNFNGTSSACPHAAGVVALMLTVNPLLTPDDVQEILESTAVDIGEPGFDEKTGHGLVNANAAVRAAAMRAVDLDVTAWTAPATAYPGQGIAAELAAVNAGRFTAGPYAIRVYLSTDNRIDETDSVLAEATATTNAGAAFERTFACVIPEDRPPEWYFLIIALDADNEIAEGDEDNNVALAPLTLIHAPNLVIKPAVVDLGTVVLGAGGEQNIQIKNEGEGSLASLTVTGIALTGSDAFSLDYVPVTPFELGANEFRTMTVYFVPHSVGAHYGTITITSTTPGMPVVEIPLSAEVVAPAPVLGVTGVPVEFGEVATSRTFSIESRGNAALVWTIDLSAKPAWLTHVSPEAGTTAAGASVSVSVTVSRNMMVPGAYAWDLPISSNGGSESVQVTMVVPAQSLELSPSAIDFGTATAQLPFTVRNSGDFVLNWTVVRDLPTWLTVDPLGGTLGADASEQVHASVSRAGLAAGVYHHEIEIASNGGSARIAVTMEVPDGVPTVSASGMPTSGAAPLTVEFTCDVAGGNGPMSFVWDFGDGSATETLRNVTHVYASAGTYTASITVTDADADTDVDSVIVTVLPKLTLTPDAATMDRAGDEREFTASGGTAPYVFDLLTPGDVADVLELENHGTGTVTVRVNPIGLLPIVAGSHSNDARVGAVSTEEYIFEIPAGDPIQSDPISPPNMTTTDVDFDVGAQTGVSLVTLRVTDNAGAQATAMIQFAALSGGWAQVYGEEAYDECAALDLVSGGGAYLTGNRITSESNGDLLIMKLADDGRPLWQKAFGTTAVETGGYSVKTTSDGGCVVSGASIHVYQAGAWIFKLDGAGVVQWHKLYKGSSFYACEILPAQAGGYWIAGTLFAETLSQNVAVVYRVTSDGEFLWTKVGKGVKHVFPIAGASHTFIRDMDVTAADGGCIVAGTALFWHDDVGDYNQDVAVIKVNSNGAASWQRSYGLGRVDEGGRFFTYTEEARSIRQTADSGSIVAAAIEGVSFSGEEGGFQRVYKAWLLKLNSSGAVVWEKAFGAVGGAMFAPECVIQTADGGYVVVGQAIRPTMERDAWIAKLSASGDILWQRTYGGPGEDTLRSVKERADGGLVAGGVSESFGQSSSPNVWVLKLNSDGRLGTNT